MRPMTACILLLAAATPTLAQSAVLIYVENDTLLPGQSTIVTLFAAWPPSQYAMAGIQTDLLISSGLDGWSDHALVAPMDGPGTSPGLPFTSGFDDIIAGQLNFPPTGVPTGANPVPFWEATYTAPIDPVAPFGVELTTLTARFDVYIDRDSAVARSFLDGLVEGNATIRVIPAPSSVVVLTGLACTCRRRR